jgi:hypothetical protein
MENMMLTPGLLIQQYIWFCFGVGTPSSLLWSVSTELVL